jgi:hypothetical protein
LFALPMTLDRMADFRFVVPTTDREALHTARE